MERKYYPINEETARAAKEMNSFTPYKEGEATEEYRYYCDKAYNILDSIAEKRPQYLERAEAMTDRYCKKLAEYYNDYYRNEAYCPSVMISGAGNFPVRKKEKQNARRDMLCSTWEYLQNYLTSLRRIKEKGTTETTTADADGNELFKVIKNTEIMRLQLIFDGKPADEIREILKKNGFKWSPKNGAWQRQLTDNALYSLKRVTETIKAII